MTPAILGTWSRPPDPVAWAALAASAVFLVLALGPESLRRSFGLGEALEEKRRRSVVLFTAFAAAFLSLGYIAYYLRGGPRIIDATSYFLQGRALSHGKLAWTTFDPTASFRGRFLIAGDGARLAGIFPPGYPLLLAAGFLVGAPMVIGPLLAAALVVLTYMVTLELTRGDPRFEPPPGRLDGHATPTAIAGLAILLSLLSAALRYHTADTMSHGAAAVGITGALVAALRARRQGGVRLFALAGLAVGWVASTRIVSSLPIAVLVLALAAGMVDPSPAAIATAAPRHGARWRALGAVALGMIPGLVLLALANRAATGSVLGFTQPAYYAVSDGPPGCFRYGFGAGIGCLYEHGDFVRAHLANGFGLVAALGTTLRRLRLHLLDVANLEPLALLVLVPAFLRAPAQKDGTKAPSRPLLAVLLVLGQILVYAPFYFDGNYPGGGARHYADVLPIEHALMAIAVALLWTRVAYVRRALVLLSFVCVGFAVHAVHDHIALAARDGGRPAYEPDTGHESQISRGLVFYGSDAAWNLAYDPKAEASHDLVAVRQRSDDHDRLIYERLGRPPSYAYRTTPEGATFNVWVPPGGSNEDFWRFESEADWPPLTQSGGWAEPDWMSGTCASGDRAMTLRPTPDTADASMTIELPVPRDGRWLIIPRIIRRGGKGKGSLTVLLPAPSPPDPAVTDEQSKLVWTWNDSDGRDACAELPGKEAGLTLKAGAKLFLEAKGGRVSLDRMSLRWVKPAAVSPAAPTKK